MPPPIRYPLPLLVGLLALSLTVWKGEAWSRKARAELAGRVRRVVEGPPVPNSSQPQIVAGPVTRRALLLHNQTPASARPGGATIQTIAERRFVEIYDTWPSKGAATHFRVGHRSPIGWVKADALLLWNSRLVILPRVGSIRFASSSQAIAKDPIAVGSLPCPVLNWDENRVEILMWDGQAPWSKMAHRGWVARDQIPDQAWGVWISDIELPIALRVSFVDDPTATRILAALGHLIDGQAWSQASRAEARTALPTWLSVSSSEPKKARERLAEANASPMAAASWGGSSFQAIPLDDLP